MGVRRTSRRRLGRGSYGTKPRGGKREAGEAEEQRFSPTSISHVDASSYSFLLFIPLPLCPFTPLHDGDGSFV